MAAESVAELVCTGVGRPGSNKRDTRAGQAEATLQFYPVLDSPCPSFIGIATRRA
ncbi:MAG: hypothetical protein WBL23_04880 [Salinisphaera sp.]|uniref:hypothetical protein n=1 Tax=Salinisphaera sp. TaxID=1914330 RepID=UPI003C7E2784